MDVGKHVKIIDETILNIISNFNIKINVHSTIKTCKKVAYEGSFKSIHDLIAFCQLKSWSEELGKSIAESRNKYFM